jgi:hypothetical protein
MTCHVPDNDACRVLDNQPKIKLDLDFGAIILEIDLEFRQVFICIFMSIGTAQSTLSGTEQREPVGSVMGAIL